MEKVGIIGFGRFGKTLYRLLANDFNLVLFDSDPLAFKGFSQDKKATIAKDLEDIYACPTVFFSVPISHFEKVITSHKKYFRDNLLIDVLSVKSHPEKIFRRILRNTKARALLTHPMFGPDSSKNGFAGLPIVLCRSLCDTKEYSFWKNYFTSKGLRVVEMTAGEHDRLAAYSQGVTHYIGRLLQQFRFSPTPIDTLGAKKLHEVMDQTCNDTWELFLNLQTYNPYTRQMRLRLGKAHDQLYNKLLPRRVNSHYVVYGIQGGVGSFNEQAIFDFIKRNKIKRYKVRYLYTTKKVLNALHRGSIDFGLFAIQNTTGGLVEESAKAMAGYKIKIVASFAIPIRHFLMKKMDVNEAKIKTIIAHPQVLRQCEKTLKNSYSHLKLTSGKGDLIDTARAAFALHQGKIPENYAILGPIGLASLYDLEIIDRNLQDNKKNFTSFFLVSR